MPLETLKLHKASNPTFKQWCYCIGGLHLELLVVFTAYTCRSEMSCYLFKGLVLAEDAMFLTYNGDHIYYISFKWSAFQYNYTSLIAWYKHDNCQWFSPPDKLKLCFFFTFHTFLVQMFHSFFSGFLAPHISHIFSSPSFPPQPPLESSLLPSSGPAAWEVFWEENIIRLIKLHLFSGLMCYHNLDHFQNRSKSSKPGSIDEEVSRVPVSASRKLQHIFLVNRTHLARKG